MRQPSVLRRAQTLLELLMVAAIIALLLAILLPALGHVRRQGQRVHCLSNLNQVGLALGAYVAGSGDRLPYIEEPLWSRFAFTGELAWDADPEDEGHFPLSFAVVMKRFLRDHNVLRCRAATIGLPRNAFKLTYRLASANNFDGVPQTIDQLEASGIRYEYSLKYLNGRPYRMRHVSTVDIPWRIAPGPGAYYLARDFMEPIGGTAIPPHNKGFNQLYLDLHTERVTHARAFTSP